MVGCRCSVVVRLLGLEEHEEAVAPVICLVALVELWLALVVVVG